MKTLAKPLLMALFAVFVKFATLNFTPKFRRKSAIMPIPSPEEVNIIGMSMFFQNEPVDIVGIDFTDSKDDTNGVAILKNPHNSKERRIPYANAYAIAKEWNVPK